MSESEEKSYAQTELLQKISAQEQQIIALQNQLAKLKKHFPEPLLQEIGDEYLLMEIFQLIPGNIVFKNRQGKTVWVNLNLKKIMLANQTTVINDIIGLYSRDMMSDELAEAVDQLDEEIMESKKGRAVEELGFDINGQQAVYLSEKIPLLDENNNAVGLLGISIDITQQKKIEKELKIAKENAEASSKAKSQFLAVVNHEIRTPLTSILGLVSFLKVGGMDKKEEQRTITDLEDCALYLLTLVNDILDFSKLDAEKMKVNMQPTNPMHILEEIQRILGPLAKEKGLNLHVNIIHPIHHVILIDAQILRQILINIINNAIKFTDYGRIDVEFKQININDNVVTLQINVRDTGCGIPENKLKIIFEPFQQVSDTYIRRSSRSGTGLGLAIVKRFSELLGLQIKVNSEEGKGTEFQLIGSFEIGEVENLNYSLHGKIEGYIEAWTKKHGAKPKILLVEDDLIVQRVHKRMLLDLGCDVDATAYGQEALAMFANHDIVFVDIGLSDITGFEVIEKLHSGYTQGFLPIIALTGYTGSEEKEKCYIAGASMVVAKPISLHQLEEVMFRYLSFIEECEERKKSK